MVINYRWCDWLARRIDYGEGCPRGVIGNIIAGFIGAWLGSLILGNWGPVIGNFYFVPALTGAILLVFIVSLIMGSMQRNR